jgi:ABC-type transport system involved in Fe-S cluster assembly fused permease/ATPase subunit
LQARKKVNKLDNLTTGKAVDALLNYETVKLFNNEQFEASPCASCHCFFALPCPQRYTARIVLADVL